MNDLHPPRAAWNPLTAFTLVLGVFVAAFFAGQALPDSVTKTYPWAKQAVTQGLMVVGALGAMATSKRPFAEFGFRRPSPAKGHFKLWGLGLGVACTGMILAFRLRGMGASIASYGLAGLVLWIWAVSSVVEEIFCRGWFQTLVTGAGESDSRGASMQSPVMWSAALFGTMHLTLLFADMEIPAIAIIVLSVTALGYVCATARARTGSLRPAIAAHVMFNVGGFLAGLIYAIAYRAATGHLPTV